jgi:ThiF family
MLSEQDWRPLRVPDDTVHQFRRRHPAVHMMDSTNEQVGELGELGELIRNEHAWYHLPWRNLLVRTVGRAELGLLLGSRNRFLLSGKELQTILESRVGIAGLSVGSRVLDPLAHGPELAEIRLADMDVVTATGLNRQPFSLADLGIPKVVAAARLVTEIRPWAGVTVFERGLDLENLDEFLDGLDVVADEMDNPVMKLALRDAAVRHGVTVISGIDVETGVLGLEPYRERPDYPPFHGDLRPETLELVRSTDNLGPVGLSALIEMIGVENISAEAMRMAEGLMRGEITSVSQLGTTATMVGGAVARLIHLYLAGRQVRTGRIVLGLDPALQGSDERMPAPTVAPR